MVFGQLSVASPQTEITAVGKAMRLFVPTAKSPDASAVVEMLQKMVSAQHLTGVDLTRPIHVLILDPKRFPQPNVLVVETKSVPKLKEELLASPAVATRTRKNVVVLGEEAALALVADYAFTLTMRDPGVRATAYVERIWAAFGEQAKAMAPMLVAAMGSSNPALKPAKLVDGLVTAVDQAALLVIDVRAGAGGVDLSFALSAKPRTPIASFISAQHPSDFALLSKLAAQDPVALIGGGDLDMSSVKTMWSTSFLGGSELTPAEQADRDALFTTLTGQMAFGGVLVPVDEMKMQYLLGVRDVWRAIALVPRLQTAFARSNADNPNMKVTVGERIVSHEGGLDINEVKLHYDMSKMTGPAQRPPFDTTSTWTGFDNLVAMSFGPTAPAMLRALVGSARNNVGAIAIPAAMLTSIAKARAAKDSFWMALVPGKLMKQQEQTSGLPAGMVPMVSVGFGDSTARLRVSMSTP